MAKKQKPAHGLMELIKHSYVLRDESDRGCALIAAAWIDDTLKELIRSQFIDDRAAADQMLEGDSPLATFSARTKLLHCIGIISKKVKYDLDIIRAIRNLFAHDRGKLGFETPEVRDRCASFSLIHEVKSLKTIMKDEPRDKYTSLSMWLIQYFLTLILSSRRPVVDPKKSIEAYFEKLREGQRRRTKEWLAEREESEE